MKTIHATLTLVLLSGLALPLAGCGEDSKDTSQQKDAFFPLEESKLISNMNDAQATSAAAADPTLYECHFDGTALNSLGEEKLRMIVAAAAEDSAPVKVYVDIKGDNANADQQAVTSYLKDNGVAADRITVAAGPNAAAGSIAAEHISRLSKTESSDTGGGYGGSSPAAAASTGGSPSGSQ